MSQAETAGIMETTGVVKTVIANGLSEEQFGVVPVSAYAYSVVNPGVVTLYPTALSIFPAVVSPPAIV